MGCFTTLEGHKVLNTITITKYKTHTNNGSINKQRINNNITIALERNSCLSHCVCVCVCARACVRAYVCVCVLGGGGVNVFYWYQTFVLDSIVITAKQLFSSHGKNECFVIDIQISFTFYVYKRGGFRKV